MRLPNAAHEAHPWLIASIAPDFDLLDVWALPVRGSRTDFTIFVDEMSSFDPSDASALTRVLFWIRFKLGALFGWDDTAKKRRIPGSADTMLRDRLADDLRAAPDRSSGGSFAELYRTDEEWAAEISNDTVHGVLHVGWVDQGDGTYRAQMGVYVKTRGLFGALYLRAIAPFRHLIVYPALLRQIGRAWDASLAGRPGSVQR